MGTGNVTAGSVTFTSPGSINNLSAIDARIAQLESSYKEQIRLRDEWRKSAEELLVERDAVLGLLSEASEWLCPHTEAVKKFREHGLRTWCCDCHNYLRSEVDASLPERVRAALLR